MDRTLLTTWLGVVFLNVLAGSSCSLVVDTDECITDADCDFGGDTRLLCVSNECVPDTRSAQQALVPATVDENLTLGGTTQWVIDGAVVVEPGASLIVEPDAVLELRDDALIVISKDATWSGPPTLTPFVIDENHGVCE